jgi:hypothetical protein
MKDSIFWRFILPDLNHFDIVQFVREFLENWEAEFKLETGIDPSCGGWLYK